jgi:hypothetical protein
MTTSNHTLQSFLGKSWSERIIPWLLAETSPFMPVDLAEAFDISAQTAATCCKCLCELDLLTAYNKLTRNKTLETTSGGVIRKYYLHGELQPYDNDAFIAYLGE